MKPLQYIICLLFITTINLGHAQIRDKQNKSVRIPAIPSETQKDSLPTKIKVAPKFESENNSPKSSNKRYTSEVPKKSFSMMETDGLKSPSEIFEQRWKKDFVKGGVIKTMSDQFLGEHRVDTKFVNIICRDHEFPDGDRVRITINGKIVQPNVLLTSQYRRIDIDLIQGRNTIDIIALNQGESGPNTAEFIVYDDKGSVVSSKEWNLLTGVKARIVFINEKVTITSNTTTASNTSSTNKGTNK